MGIRQLAKAELISVKHGRVASERTGTLNPFSYLLPLGYPERRSAPKQASIELPHSVGSWTSIGAPKRITREDIFKYMDGSGEMYLGYRFQFLDAWAYINPFEDGITAEIYQMQMSDDAYGLLSFDWGGEPLDDYAPTGEPRALYGAGLLRVWAGDVYARVAASTETEHSRRAVFALGRAILCQRNRVAAPALVRILP